MKIAKSQLKQIIKEEIPKILSEGSPQSELGLPHEFDNKELYKIGRQQSRDPDSQLRTDRKYAAKFVAQISNKLRKGRASPGLEALRHDIESSFTPSLDTLQSRRHAKDQKRRYSSRPPGPDEPLSVYEEMKITKAKLKEIIKEEISNTLSESEYDIATGVPYMSPLELEWEKKFDDAERDTADPKEREAKIQRLEKQRQKLVDQGKLPPRKQE